MKKIKKILFFTLALTALMLCCLFSFTASAEAGGNFGSARSIKVNTKYTDNIYTEHDKDYYKFTLTSDGYVYLNFTRENIFDDKVYWSATLYNDNTKSITDYAFSGAETNTKTYKIGLSAGSYYLKFTAGDFNPLDENYYHSAVKYNFSIKFKKSSYWESEKNETYKTANNILLNKTYGASICEENDIDYYKVTIPSDGYVYLNFTRENLFDDKVYWSATLYNDNTKSITDYAFSGAETNTKTYKIGLSAGSYYLKFTAGDFNPLDENCYHSAVKYNFSIKFKKSSYWETEKNETYKTATNILLNKEYSGSICEENDIDYYKFTIRDKTNISIKFNEKITAEDTECYIITILNSNTKELKYIPITTNATSVSEKISVNPGTYFVKVIGGGYCDFENDLWKDTYTFSVSIGTTSKITSTKTTSSVTLKWNKVTGASGYRVFQKVDGKWKTLGDTSKTTYTIKNLKAGTKYTFAVRAYILNGKTKVMAPKYKSISVTTADTLGVTSKITPTQTTSSVTLKWNKVTGATGYRIYTMRKGEWKKLVDTTKLTYTEKKLGSGSTYKYRVKAYTKKNGKTVWATKYKEIETSTKPATSTLKVSSTAKGKAVLNWSNPSGESGFEIYYSTKKDSGFKKIATTKANVKKATVSKLQSKKTYYFKVRSYKTTASGKAYSAYSAVKGIKVK